MKRLLCLILALLLLCGCTAAPVGTTVPETTVPATTTGPVLKPGYYIPEDPDLADMYVSFQLIDGGYGFLSLMGAFHELSWTPEGAEFEGMTIIPTEGGLLADGEAFTHVGAALPEGYMPDAPAPGVYAVSSVGLNGGVSFYGALSRENGYLQIREDGTGVLVFEDAEYPFTLDGATALFDGWSVMLLDMSDRDTGGSAMVTIYVLDGPLNADSIIFRLLEDEA